MNSMHHWNYVDFIHYWIFHILRAPNRTSKKWEILYAKLVFKHPFDFPSNNFHLNFEVNLMKIIELGILLVGKKSAFFEVRSQSTQYIMHLLSESSILFQCLRCEFVHWHFNCRCVGHWWPVWNQNIIFRIQLDALDLIDLQMNCSNMSKFSNELTLVACD